MVIPAVYVHGGVGLLLAALSLPLALRRVPPNGGYGIRIPEAFASGECWYDINAFGGRLFLAYGLLLAGGGLLARDLEPPVTSLWSPVFVALPLAGVLLLIVPVRAYARRRLRRHAAGQAAGKARRTTANGH